jgi:hypothetical protein
MAKVTVSYAVRYRKSYIPPRPGSYCSGVSPLHSSLDHPYPGADQVPPHGNRWLRPYRNGRLPSAALICRRPCAACTGPAGIPERGQGPYPPTTGAVHAVIRDEVVSRYECCSSACFFDHEHDLASFVADSAVQKTLWGEASPARHFASRSTNASRSDPESPVGSRPYACRTRTPGRLSSRRSTAGCEAGRPPSTQVPMTAVIVDPVAILDGSRPLPRGAGVYLRPRACCTDEIGE